MLDHSRLELVTLSDGAEYDRVQGNAQRGKHADDGLIVSTAKESGSIFVTGETKRNLRLRRKAEECGVEPWGLEKFAAYLRSLTPAV